MPHVRTGHEVKLEFASPEELVRRNAQTAQLPSLTEERMSYSSAVPAEKLQIDPGYQERSLTIEALQKRIPEFVSASVMQPAPANRVTTTYIHGEYEMQHRGVQIMNVNG